MLIDKEPYFMKNRSWWTIDEDNDIIILTNKAPLNDPQIKESYKEYVKTHNMAKACRGGYTKNVVDVDDDEAFEKFFNEMMAKQ